ncbi:MAG: acyl-CoA thioesterase [Planctomycetaceae bacterium]|jgi:acyl-CoA thioester hydrolase|nr:acyl-CoA thioesterase [Planctomycetaceae bacterium]
MAIPYFDMPVIVSADDIDEMEHANNVCYIRWMQDAAVAHSTANGWETQRYLDFGSAWYARKHTIEYLAPAFLGEQLIVQTWVSDWKTVRSTRCYRFVRPSDKTIVAIAETCWAFVNLTTKRPTKIPKEVTDCFIVQTAKPDLPK